MTIKEVISSQEEQYNRMSTKQSGKRLRWLFLTATLAILAFLLFLVVGGRDAENINVILTNAKLGKLPGSIKNLKYETRRESFNKRLLFIRFQADPNDIQHFIGTSSSIDTNRSRPMNTASYSEENPTWWSIDRSATGWIYALEVQDSIRAGNVAVDEESDTILIAVWYTVNPKVEIIEDKWHDVKDVFN
jgi:hypothetical protein